MHLRDLAPQFYPQSKRFPPVQPKDFPGILPAEEGFRQQFSADGTAVEYRLLSTVISVDKVTVDGVEVADGSYDRDTCTYTFNTAPVEGVNNVEFFCSFFDISTVD